MIGSSLDARVFDVEFFCSDPLNLEFLNHMFVQPFLEYQRVWYYGSLDARVGEVEFSQVEMGRRVIRVKRLKMSD